MTLKHLLLQPFSYCTPTARCRKVPMHFQLLFRCCLHTTVPLPCVLGHFKTSSIFAHLLPLLLCHMRGYCLSATLLQFLDHEVLILFLLVDLHYNKLRTKEDFCIKPPLSCDVIGLKPKRLLNLVVLTAGLTSLPCNCTQDLEVVLRIQ